MPMRPAGQLMPPEPMLQGMPGHLTDPQQDMANKLEADTEANNKLGWVDEKAGIARIPVKDAMQLIRGEGIAGGNPMPEEKK